MHKENQIKKDSEATNAFVISIFTNFNQKHLKIFSADFGHTNSIKNHVINSIGQADWKGSFDLFKNLNIISSINGQNLVYKINSNAY